MRRGRYVSLRRANFIAEDIGRRDEIRRRICAEIVDERPVLRHVETRVAVVRFAPILTQIPLEVLQRHVFKHLLQLEQKAVACSCKTFKGLVYLSRAREYHWCVACKKRIRPRNRFSKLDCYVVKLPCGCRYHYECGFKYNVYRQHALHCRKLAIIKMDHA